MSELANRDFLEADFALRLSRLTTRQRKELESYLNLTYPPSFDNVPADAWDRWEQELNDDLTLLLLLIAASSFRQHGGQMVPFDQAATTDADRTLLQRLQGITKAEQQQSAKPGESPATSPATPPDAPPPPLIQWARDSAAKTSSDWTDHSKEILQRASDEWKDAEPGDITPGEIRDKALDIFGPDRSARAAVNETTRAQHEGGEYAIDTTVGRSPEDRWITRNDRKVCPVCTPLNNTPRSYWERFFPGGPPDPHPLCRCYIAYQNQPAEVAAG